MSTAGPPTASRIVESKWGSTAAAPSFYMRRSAFVPIHLAALALVSWALRHCLQCQQTAAATQSPAPIRFELKKLPFHLDSSLSPAKECARNHGRRRRSLRLQRRRTSRYLLHQRRRHRNSAEIFAEVLQPALSQRRRRNIYRRDRASRTERHGIRRRCCHWRLRQRRPSGHLCRRRSRQHAVPQQRRRHVYRRDRKGRPRQWNDPEYGPLWAVAAVWVDVNNDGLLDLFIVNYLQWELLYIVPSALSKAAGVLPPPLLQGPAQPALPQPGRWHVQRCLQGVGHPRPRRQGHGRWAWPTTISTASPISSSPTMLSTISCFTTWAISLKRSLSRPTWRWLKMPPSSPAWAPTSATSITMAFPTSFTSRSRARPFPST